jgi:hypothetical protein
MAKKQYFAILDTETTIADTVADFAIVICDRQGKIYNQCAVLLKNHFDAFDLFYDKNVKGLWSFEYAQTKKVKYNEMLNSGSRMLASVSAINNWINQAIGKYDPILTAYNLAFDKSKCANTGIILDGFSENFCLWQAAVGNICNSKKFKQFCLENHAFNTPTEYGNMTFKTNAEVVCGFIQGEFVTEPHTALEDARDFELPILREILKKKNWKQKVTPYNWREFQTRDHFVAK